MKNKKAKTKRKNNSASKFKIASISIVAVVLIASLSIIGVYAGLNADNLSAQIKGEKLLTESVVKEIKNDAAQSGFDAGFDAGYEAGSIDGYNQGFQDNIPRPYNLNLNSIDELVALEFNHDGDWSQVTTFLYEDGSHAATYYQSVLSLPAYVIPDDVAPEPVTFSKDIFGSYIDGIKITMLVDGVELVVETSMYNEDDWIGLAYSTHELGEDKYFVFYLYNGYVDFEFNSTFIGTQMLVMCEKPIENFCIINIEALD